MSTEKKSTFRIRRIGLWVSAALLILLAGIYALRGVIIAPYAIGFLERTVAANLGLQISIGHLGGSYISDLEVKNVTTVRRLTEGPLTDVQLRRLKLTYRLWDIFKGLPVLMTGAMIELEGAKLSIQLTGEADGGAGPASDKRFALPPYLPQIRVHDSFIELKGPAFETRFKGISLVADSASSGASRLKLRVAQWLLKHPALTDFAVALGADMFYSGESLRIEKLLVDKRLLVKSAIIGLEGLPDDIPFAMQLVPADGQLAAEGRVAANRLQVELSGSDIDLRRISGLLAPSAVPFGGYLALRGNLELPFSDPGDMISDLVIQLGNGSVNQTSVEQLAFRFTAGGRYLKVADLQLTNGSNRLNISRASLPADILSGSRLDGILRSLTVDWKLQASDIPAALKLFGLTLERHDDRIPAHRLILNGRLEGGNLIIPDGRLDADGGHVALKAASIALPLGERTLNASPVSGNLSVDLPDAKALSQIFALPALGGSLQGQIKVSGTLQSPLGSARISGRSLSYRNRALGNLTARMRGDIKGIAIESALLERDKDRVSGQGVINLSEKSFENFRIEVSVVDLEPYFTDLLPLVRPSLQKTVSVRGGLTATAKIDGPFSGPRGLLNLQTRQIRFKDLQLETFDLKISSSGRLVRIESTAAARGQKQFLFAGDIQRNPADTEFGLTLKKATFIRRGSTLLALEREAGCRLFRNGRVFFDSLILAGPVGKVSINGRFEPGGLSNLEITTSKLDGDGWLDLLVADRLLFQGLDARIKVTGRSAAPSFTVEGTLDSIGSPAVPMRFSGRFKIEYDQKVFKIHHFEWHGQKGQQIELAGALPLDLYGKNIFAAGQIALTGRSLVDDLRALGFVLPWAASTGGSIQCDLNLGGTWAHPVGRLNLEVDGLGRPAEIRPLPPGPYTIDGVVRIDGDRVTLESLEASSAGWEIEAQGHWRGAPTMSDLIDRDMHMQTGQVSLEASLAVSDLSWIPPQVEGVRRLTGRLEAQGSLQGPLNAPRGDATVKLIDAEFAPDFDIPSLHKLNLDAAVTPQAVNIRSFAGELGGAPFELKGSWELTAGQNFSADLRLSGQNILLYRNDDLRLRADTELTLKGPLERLELAGEVAVTGGRFSKNFGVVEGFTAAGRPDTGGGFRLFSIQKPPLRDMVFDVKITAKEPFNVRNNLARGSVRPDLVLAGTGEIPLLLGKIYVESTRLYLPAGRLQLETGLVHFEQADPERPRLDLIGTSTMLGYEIKAVIEGPYDEPSITLSSIPPLPNEELLMLLLTGQPPKKTAGRSSGMKQGLNVAVFLGRDLMSRLFGSEPDEYSESIIDRFDVEVGRAITRQGEDTIDSQFRLADDVLIDGDSLYLTGERDRFDYYNGGIKFVIRFR